MYAERLKESMGGILGSFTMKERKLVEVDTDSDLQFATQSILYLMDAVTEYKNLKRLALFGEKGILSVYFYSDYIIGVFLACTANLELLNLIMRRILAAPEEPLEITEEAPEVDFPVLRKVPYFDRPREEILDNVPSYARQVLEFVDGTSTIDEIIKKSNLPPEVVLDVILSYRRSSVIHYK